MKKLFALVLTVAFMAVNGSVFAQTITDNDVVYYGLDFKKAMNKAADKGKDKAEKKAKKEVEKKVEKKAKEFIL